MATQNGVFENSTGNLVKAGFSNFTGQFDPADFTQRTDVPLTAIVQGEQGALQMSRWNGSAWILVAQPGILKVTSNRAGDFDGVPVAPSNGVALHTLTIQKVDANGASINSGNESIRILADWIVPMSDTTPQLVNGTVQITVGPTKQVGQGRICACDPNRVLTSGSLVIRFRSKIGSKEPIRSPGFISGAVLSAMTDSTVTLGKSGVKSELRDSTDQFDLEGVGQRTADITIAGAGGLQVGLTEQPDTWYAVLVIGDTSEQNPIVLMLTDAANYLAPTLPAGYDVFRRVAWVRNNASSNFQKLIQTGNGPSRQYNYDVSIGQVLALSGGNATAFTAISFGSLVPPTARSVQLVIAFQNVAAGDRARFRVTGSTVGNPPYQFRPGVVVGSAMSTFFQLLLNDAQSMEYIVDDAGNSLDLAVLGYLDEI